MISTLPSDKVPEPSFAAEPPPKRFCAAAKEAWVSVPETVRTDVLRMEKELAAGLKKHQAAAARDADLADFHDRAAKGGTTLKEALSKYVGMEDMLRTDLDKGLDAIFQNIGISPREWAAKLLGRAPDATATQQDAKVQRLEAEIADLKSCIAEREQQETDSTTETVMKFAAAHPRLEELSEDIVFFLDSGRADNLAEAYELAERFNLAPRPN